MKQESKSTLIDQIKASKIKLSKTSSLIPYARNARKHTDNQIAQIAGSIREFGFTVPVIIDQESGIIAGHGRVLAAQMLKIEEIPTIVVSHLTKAQQRAYIIADNKLAANSQWDFEQLQVEMAELKDLDVDLNITGFNDNEIDAILKDVGNDSYDDESEDDELKTPKMYMIECPHCQQQFEQSQGKKTKI